MGALFFRLHNTRAMLHCKRLLSVLGGCPVRWIPVLALSAAFTLASSIAAQSLQNSQFQLAYSPSGLTSLKHVQDKYDTDYIAGGRTVGDVLIRYRATGEKTWKKASAAVLNTSVSANPKEVSFKIGELVPTLAFPFPRLRLHAIPGCFCPE